MNDERQLEVVFMQSWGVMLTKFSGKSSLREKTLTNTNLVALRHFERKNATLPVGVVTSLLSSLITVRCIYAFNQRGHKPLWK